MGPDPRISREEFFHSSICGKVFGVVPGRAVSGTGHDVLPSRWCGRRPARAAAGTGGGRLHTSFLNLAVTGYYGNLPVAARTLPRRT